MSIVKRSQTRSIPRPIPVRPDNGTNSTHKKINETAVSLKIWAGLSVSDPSPGRFRRLLPEVLLPIDRILYVALFSSLPLRTQRRAARHRLPVALQIELLPALFRHEVHDEIVTVHKHPIVAVNPFRPRDAHSIHELALLEL